VSLFTELKRRKVLKFGGGYLVVAWLIAATGASGRSQPVSGSRILVAQV
jgi:hypothetical protein